MLRSPTYLPCWPPALLRRSLLSLAAFDPEPIELEVLPGAAAIRVFDQVRGVEVTAADPNLLVTVRLVGTTVEGTPFEIEVEVDENGLYIIPEIPRATLSCYRRSSTEKPVA